MSPGPWRLIWRPEAVEVGVARATVMAIERGHDVSAIADAMERAERELLVNPADLGVVGQFEVEELRFVSPRRQTDPLPTSASLGRTRSDFITSSR